MYDPKFVHLNVHSDYSIIDSICKVNDILKYAYKLETPCIALTDYFNLSSIVKFSKKSYFYGIKPIFGIDIGIFFKEIYSINFSTLLVMNEIGYNNLLKLISIAYKNYDNSILFLYIDYELLNQFSNGLVLLYSINYYSILNKKFFNYKNKIVINHILFFKKYFHYLYMQIFRLSHKYQDTYIKDIIFISKETSTPLIATNKVLFFKKKDFYIHKIRSCIYYSCYLNKISNYIDYTKEYYFKTEMQMCKLFSDLSSSLDNTVEVAKMCNFLFEDKKIRLPKLTFLDFFSSNDYLKNMVLKGFKKRINFKNNNELKNKYLLRINKEFKIIFKLKITNYFLIVMEFVNWSKNNNIYVGPGRGSGAGSLVAYLLYITDVDPIKFDLIFERFLNLERVSMPDFDIDFCMKKRDKVISHLEKLYGSKSVAQIVTFSTMTTKSVLRDVGRVLGYPYGYMDYLAKLIPLDINITLKKSLIIENKLSSLYKKDKDIRKLFNICFKLEGIIKGIGKHAGGIVISPNLITDFCSTFYDKDSNKYVTQLDKNDIKCVGLIKFDLLGLRTLTVIDNTIININKKKYLYNNLNINNISLRDNLSFSLLKKSDTISVFQLESKGMRDLIKKLKPDNFDDIIALLALYRPGPLKSGMVDNFINRKHGNENIYYPDINCQHKLLKPILKNTYGIILYQEQVMKIAQVLSNYTLGEADDLRVVIGDKNKEKMKLHKKKFLNGSKKIGVSKDISLNIFSLIKNFASYGFNKSHSVSYSLLSYQTLWLKSNFTAEYLVSFMNADIDNINKIVIIINEAKKFNINIIYPNINLSIYYFYVDKNNNIVYGLGAIKGIGKSSIKHIIKIRKENNIFTDYINFCILIYNRKITKLVLEKLIFSGSLDIFKINRSIMYHYIKEILNIIKSKKNILDFKQLSLFNNYNDNLINIYKKINITLPKLDDLSLLHKEKEVLGFYLTDHPVKKYINYIKLNFNFVYIKDLYYFKNNYFLTILGLITNIKFIYTKNNNKMCVLNLDDSTSNIDVLVFKNIYVKYSNLIDINNMIVIYGSLKCDSNSYKNIFLANCIKLMLKK